MNYVDASDEEEEVVEPVVPNHPDENAEGPLDDQESIIDGPTPNKKKKPLTESQKAKRALIAKKLKFLEHYEMYPCLYLKTDPDYYNREKIQHSWFYIAKALGVSGKFLSF